MDVDIDEAGRQLDRLGELARRGEAVIITKEGRPYLELMPHRGGKRERRLGLLKGKIWTAPDFDRTPEDVVEAFEGR